MTAEGNCPVFSLKAFAVIIWDLPQIFPMEGLFYALTQGCISHLT